MGRWVIDWKGKDLAPVELYKEVSLGTAADMIAYSSANPNYENVKAELERCNRDRTNCVLMLRTAYNQDGTLTFLEFSNKNGEGVSTVIKN